MISLNDLRDNYGARKLKKRLGRGPGSGLGKTCGRGHKGTGQRNKLQKRGFEGGQSPIWKKTPKYGYLRNKKYVRTLKPLALDKLMMWIQNGRIDTSKTVTMKMLKDSGVMSGSGIKDGIRLKDGGLDTFVKQYPKLGLPAPHLQITDSCPKAKEAVELIGGTVELVYFARVPLRAHFMPHKFDILPRGPGFPPRKLREKYGWKLPEDRIYTGLDKKKTFDIRPGAAPSPNHYNYAKSHFPPESQSQSK